LVFGKFPKWFLLSCFAKKVSKEREKGENSRAHSRGARKPPLLTPPHATTESSTWNRACGGCIPHGNLKRSCLVMPPFAPSGNKSQRNHRKDGVGKILILPFTQVSVISAMIYPVRGQRQKRGGFQRELSKVPFERIALRDSANEKTG